MPKELEIFDPEDLVKLLTEIKKTPSECKIPCNMISVLREIVIKLDL